MTSARDYNAAQMQAGRLTLEHITALVRAWQAQHGLDADGMAGPLTIAKLEAEWKPAPFLACPLPVLADGRRAVVTNGFTDGVHFGLDFFYPWQTGDVPAFVGDHGAEGRKPNGAPAWVVPAGTRAVAAAAGRVVFAADTPTGHAVQIDHGNGWTSGVYHLASLLVAVGDRVLAGQAIGVVGDNPAAPDGDHVHFELSPSGAYAPIDPTPYLMAA